MSIINKLDTMVLKDTAADPTAAGELQRNGADLKFHDGTAARTLLHSGGATQYVVRDATTADFTVANFTCDGAWHVDGLDLSAIVPSGAIAVDLHIEIDDDALSRFSLRRDATNGLNRIYKYIQVVNRRIPSTERIAVNSDRLLDYYADNVVFTSINVTVVGWIL